jgi:cytosine/adenosine deaminase-related metal-dependent hydrolase
MAPVGDPVEAIVRSALPHNVDTVVVDGRILKAGGRFTAIDTAQVVVDARNTLEALKARTGLS